MADVPKDLLDEINKLEDLFIVDAQKLKEVTDQFVSELERGLGQNDATIVRRCYPPRIFRTDSSANSP
jgi:hexokinase